MFVCSLMSASSNADHAVPKQLWLVDGATTHLVVGSLQRSPAEAHGCRDDPRGLAEDGLGGTPRLLQHGCHQGVGLQSGPNDGHHRLGELRVRARNLLARPALVPRACSRRRAGRHTLDGGCRHRRSSHLRSRLRCTLPQDPLSLQPFLPQPLVQIILFLLPIN